MKYLFYNHRAAELNIYPFSDWHIGAKQCNIDFIKRLVKRVENDPIGVWIYMGDAGECVTKTSKGDAWEQTLSPGDQLRTAAQLMRPVADKGLFGVCGNHGRRIDREVGIGWDELLCSKVGIPYAGIAGFIGIQMEDLSGHRTSVNVYAHHGASGSTSPVGKIRAAAKPLEHVVADIVLTGHSHGCGEVWPPKVYAQLDNKNKRIKWACCRAFACGSAFDSRSGYAEEKMYSPIIPEQLCINVKQVTRSYKKKVSLGIDIQYSITRDHPDISTDHELAKWSEDMDDMEIF